MNFKGKAVLVTGAASGLGRATAMTLAGLGAELCLVDVRAEALHGVGDAARAQGASVEAVALDLSQRADCAAAVDAAVARFGGLDGLCNVAGVIAPAHFEAMAPERFEQIMAVNFAAPFFLSQRAIPHLLARNGAIVNVASCAAYMGQAYLAAYAASKAAVLSLTKSLAIEYANRPLRVSAVAPGGMDTDMVANIAFPADADFTLVQRFSGLRGSVPVQEVAELIVLLASERGAAFHGTCVQIDAGVTAG